MHEWRPVVFHHLKLSLIFRRVILLLVFSYMSDTYAHAVAPPTSLPKTGQTVCYKAKVKATIDCAGTGQDGGTLTGVAWPNPRFTGNPDQTMIDRLTGLVWPKDANPAGGANNWQQALDYIKTLNSRDYLGHNDWRLPNINELESLVNKGPNLAVWLESQGFMNVRVDYYWTSSTYASYTGYAWSVSVYGGIVAGRGKEEGSYVWPVRGGQSGVVSLPRTGQTACYENSGKAIACVGTGQDGELQTGTAWPSPRFSDNADQTMTDRLTGLIWSKDGKVPGPAGCGPGTYKTWQEALDYVTCLNTNNYLGKNDWRLPNRNEQTSLVNHGQPNSAVWLNSQGFSNIEADSYWTSTTYSYAIWNAWSIGMQDGSVTTLSHKRSTNVWPVRSGQ